jgi:hypothetical protein
MVLAMTPRGLHVASQMGLTSRCVGGNQSYMHVRAASGGRYASVEARARRPLASHASNSKVAAPPPRQRISSSPQRARPIPGTARGVEGSTLTRQRVVAAVGCRKAFASACRRQRRGARPITPEPSAASCNRRDAVMERWATSATTVPSLGWRRASSKQARTAFSSPALDIDHSARSKSGLRERWCE